MRWLKDGVGGDARPVFEGRVNTLMVTEGDKTFRDEFIALVFEPPDVLLRLAPEYQVKFRDVLRELLPAVGSPTR